MERRQGSGAAAVNGVADLLVAQKGFPIKSRRVVASGSHEDLAGCRSRYQAHGTGSRCDYIGIISVSGEHWLLFRRIRVNFLGDWGVKACHGDMHMYIYGYRNK
jgi:hypothetical protein